MRIFLQCCTLLVITAALLAYSTKPTDQECIFQLRGSADYGNDLVTQLFSRVEYNRYTLRIEDHVFYKRIYSATGERIGIAAFGRVIKSDL